LQKIACTPTAYGLDLRDFANFVKIWGLFSNTPLMKDLNLFPHEWWDLIRISGRTFAPISCHIKPRMCSHHHVNKFDYLSFNLTTWHISFCKKNWIGKNNQKKCMESPAPFP
jgi:hypothetical protein